MQVKGKITFKGETKDVGTNGFQSRDLVVTTDEQYPQDILIQFVQANCNLIEAYQIGQQVTVDINLRGRKWTNPEGEEKYFNSIQGWRISLDTTPAATAPAASQPAAAAPAPVAQTPVAPSQRKLVMLVKDFTYEQYNASGWTDAQLLQHKKAEYQTTAPAAAPAPAATVPPAEDLGF